jgi:hypothetical protein
MGINYKMGGVVRRGLVWLEIEGGTPYSLISMNEQFAFL